MKEAEFLQTLREWSEGSDKFVRKSFELTNREKVTSLTYILQIAFSYKGDLIIHHCEINKYEEFDDRGLNMKLYEFEEPFYKKVKDYIKEEWYDISLTEPPIREEIDLLVLYTTMDFENGKSSYFQTYIFATGKYQPPEIVTSNKALNFQISIQRMSIIYWNNLLDIGDNPD